MYRCLDCKREFKNYETLFENHQLQTPPYEEIHVCPSCKSTNIKENVTSHCRCCGARIIGDKEYCDNACRRRGEKMWMLERKRKQERENSPLTMALREVESYNKTHGTKLSYGEYFAAL